MPKGSKVHKQYKALRRKGYSKKSSARIAQSNTGQSLKTGRKPKRRAKKKKKR